jgi:threonine dehydrogenase-like Zn-dependent dehydrogenase
MRAAVFKGPGQPLSIEILPDPVPLSGEAVIKVQRCGVCGTDLHMTSGHGNDAPIGSVIGHEYCGEVVALGKDTAGLKVGDFVTAVPAVGCGHCPACVAGYTMACLEMEGMVGGFGEFMRISAPNSIVLPKTLSPADGALVEPLAVGLRVVAIA